MICAHINFITIFVLLTSCFVTAIELINNASYVPIIIYVAVITRK